MTRQTFWFVPLGAALLPSLLAYNLSPSPTYLNQALAFGLWGAFAAVSSVSVRSLAMQPRARTAAAWPPALALLLLAAAALWSWGPGALPASIALSALGTLAAALVLLLAGQAASPGPTGAAPDGSAPTEPLFVAFSWAFLITGVLNTLVAAIQVFAPDLPDGDWIAASGIVGRAVGNLRQPNHLSSLLLWSCIAAVALLELRRLSLRWAGLALAAFVFAVVLTASRTGLVSVLLLGLWGLLDRRLSRHARVLLLAAPLVYALAWWGLAQWAQLSQHSFGGTARLAETDISGSRFGIWANTLALIRSHPLTGVGLGEFNFAWTLTPFPGRPVAFFDHAHNLPLQLAAELGLPLAGLVLGLLLWSLGRAAWTAWRTPGDAGTAQRAAVLMVVMIGLHSLLEYPLWYSYFLLPTAWALGFALRPAAVAAPAPPAEAAPPAARLPALSLAGWLLVAGALFSVWDYLRVSRIFVVVPGGPSLEQRIAAGQRSVFFAHHADYAAATTPGLVVADRDAAFERAAHHLLDTRLMMAWARHRAAEGDLEAARHLAARLREFGRAESEGFFDACPEGPPPAAATAPELPFQCQAPAAVLPLSRFEPSR